MTIYVLEDELYRVHWLRAQFPAHRVTWYDNVNSFATALDVASAPPTLLVLDHDLGAGEPGTWPLDASGKCGTDAVEQLPDRWRHVPVIIWSYNTRRAVEMVRRLTERGFSAVHVAFDPDAFGPLRRALQKALDHESS